MRMLFIMLTQDIFAIVVTVGSPNDGMDMIPRRLRCSKGCNSTLVIELDEDDWTVHAVVVDTFRSRAANPAQDFRISTLY